MQAQSTNKANKPYIKPKNMNKYPKIGIRPTIDGRQGGVRESLEEKTMNLAKSVAKLISGNLRNGDGSPVELSLIHI